MPMTVIDKNEFFKKCDDQVSGSACVVMAASVALGAWYAWQISLVYKYNM